MILDQKLEELLRTKKFSALTEEEKVFVSEKMTETEYRNFRLILCGSRNGLNKIRTAPSPRVKENLMAAMRAKKAKKRTLAVSWKRIANYRVPAWQAAAAIAFLMFSMLTLRQEIVIVESMAQPLMVTDTVFETVYKTDTVFEKIPVFLTGKKNVNVKPGVLDKEPDSNEVNLISNSGDSQSVENEQDMILIQSYNNRLLADSTPVHLKSQPWPDISPRGRSAGEDAHLMQFFTEIN